jgi:hypothetical protein
MNWIAGNGLDWGMSGWVGESYWIWWEGGERKQIGLAEAEKAANNGELSPQLLLCFSPSLIA